MWRDDQGLRILTKRGLKSLYILTAALIVLIRFGQSIWPPHNMSQAGIYFLLFIGFFASIFGDWDSETIHRDPMFYIGVILLLGGIALAR